MASIPYDPTIPNDTEAGRPDCRFVSDVNDASQPPLYSAELIGMLQEFEWEGQEDGGTVRNLQDPASHFPTSDRIVEALLPLAQRQAREFRTKPRNNDESVGYHDRLDVLWTRPLLPMPFRYNRKYAHAAGDEDDEYGENSERLTTAPPPSELAEFNKMKSLTSLHA